MEEEYLNDLQVLQENGADEDTINSVKEDYKSRGFNVDSVGKTNPAQIEGAPAQEKSNAPTSESSGDSTNTQNVIEPTVTADNTEIPLGDSPTGTTGDTLELDPNNRVPDENLSSEEKIKNLDTELAEFSTNFNDTLAQDEEFKVLQNDATVMAQNDIQDFSEEAAEKYGYDTPEFWKAIEGEYQSLYEKNMNDLGVDDLSKRKYQEGYEAINTKYGDDLTPDFVKNSNFLLGIYRFIKTTLPKQAIGGLRLSNSNQLQISSSFIDNYNECLADGSCKETDVVGVNLANQSTLGAGPGSQGNFKDMTVKDALAFYQKKANEEIDLELESQGATEVLNREASLIPQAYNLEDGVGFSDVPGLLGESLPYMGMMMVPGGVVATGVLTAGGTYSDNLDAVAQQKCDATPGCTSPTSETYLDIIESGGDSQALAVATGAVVSALEKAGFDKMGKAFFKPDVIKALLRGQVVKTLRAGAGAIGQGYLGEAVTEAVQTLVEQLSKGTALGSPTSQIDIHEISLAAQAGGISGGVVSAGGVATNVAAVKSGFTNTPQLKVGKVDTKTLDNLNLTNDQGGAKLPSEAINETVASKKNLDKVFDVGPKAFEETHEYKMATLQAELEQAPKSEQAAVLDSAKKELDLAEAFYTINQPQFSTIKGRAKKAAGNLLYERAQLQRTADSGTGLDQSSKDRVKIIDEKLSNIERRSKQGVASNTLEKIRNAVGPKRSVGAARKSSSAQKVIDSLDTIINEGVDVNEFLNSGRLGEVLQSAGITSAQKADTEAAVSSHLKAFANSEYTSLGDFTRAQDRTREQYEVGETDETINATSQREIANQPIIGGKAGIGESIGQLSNFTSQKGKLIGRSLEQQQVNTKTSEANTAEIRSQAWSSPRITVQANSAEKKISAFNKKPKDAERNSATIQALREFSDIKNVVDSLVHQYINQNIPGREGVWDILTDKMLELDNQLATAEDKSALKKEIKATIAEMSNLYILGLREIESSINHSVVNNNYPPYFNIDSTTGVGRFDFNFKNKFGSEVLYDMFPNGEEDFNNMKITDWADFINKVNIWQGKTGNQKTKEEVKVKEFAKKKGEELANKKDAKESGYKYEAREDAKFTKALRAIQKSGGKLKSIKVTDDITDVPVAEVTDSSADIKWQTLSKDIKTAYEGEILHLLVVKKERQGKGEVLDQLLSEYVANVDKYSTLDFISKVSSIDFSYDNNVSDSINKIDLITQLSKANRIEGSGIDITTSSTGQIDTINETKKDIKNIEEQIGQLEDGTKKSNLRLELNDKNSLLQRQETLYKAALTLPSVDTSVIPDIKSYQDNIAISYASQVIAGEQVGIDPALIEQTDLDNTPDTLTKDELVEAIALFEGSTIELQKILNQQAKLSDNIRSLGITEDLATPITGAARADIETLADKSEQLNNRRNALREAQSSMGRLIAAVELGKTKVDALESSINDLYVETKEYITNPTKATAKFQGELDGYVAQMAAIDIEIEAAKKEFEAAEADTQLKQDLEFNYLGLLNKHSEVKAYANNLEGLINLPARIKGNDKINISKKYGPVENSLTTKEKEKIEKTKKEAEEAVEEMGQLLRRGRIALTEGHIAAKPLQGMPLDAIQTSMAYALRQVDEGGFPTAHSFISGVSSTLPFNLDKSLSEEERNNIKAYSGAYILSILEDNDIIRLVEPEYTKDTWKIEILSPDFVVSFVQGMDLANSTGKVAHKLELDEAAWTKLQKTKPADWTSHIHESGLKAEGKRKGGDYLNITDHPNAFKILNAVKDQGQRYNQNRVNAVELLKAIGVASLNANEKNYKPSQKAGIQLETNSVIQLSKSAGQDVVYGNAKFGSRFRLYSSVAYVGHQAGKMAQSFIDSDKPTITGSDGIMWLMADLAENAGAKVNEMHELVSFAYENLPTWLEQGSDLATHAEKIWGDKNGNGALDAPPLFQAGILEFMAALEHGDPTTYPSHYISYIDDSASGYQHAGGITKSLVVMKDVNLAPNNRKIDPYVTNVEPVLEEKGILAENATEEQLKYYNNVHSRLKEFKAQREAAISSDAKYTIPNPDFGKTNTRTEENPELVNKENIEVSEARFVKYQKDLFWETVDKDLYNGIFWGQTQWIGKLRKAGKEGLMKGLYGARTYGLAEGLYDDFSSDRATGDDIVIENTLWLITHVKASIKQRYKAIANLEAEVQLVQQEKIDTVLDAKSEWDSALADQGASETDIEEFKANYEAAMNNLDFKYEGKFGLPSQPKYRAPLTTRVNYKSTKNDIKFEYTVGSKNEIDKGAINKIKGASFVNLIHTLDKELVAYLWLNKDALGLTTLFTVHDAYGTTLGNMRKLFSAIREARKEIYKEDVMYDVFKENVEDERAKEISERLTVKDWDPNMTDHNQHSTGKSGKADADKIVQGLKERAGITSSANTSVAMDQTGGEIKTEDGNIKVTQSPKEQSRLEKLITEGINADTHIHSLSKTTAMSIENISSIAESLGNPSDAINISKVVTSLNQAAKSNDTKEFNRLLDELDSSTEHLRGRSRSNDKTLKTQINNLISAYNVYGINFVAQEQVDKVNTIDSFIDGIDVSLEEKVETNEQPKHLPEFDRDTRDDSQIC